MEDTLWRQLASKGKLWITGHSKGGALATTAAARLLHQAPPPPHCPEANLRHLSVLSFNAPMALCDTLADDYIAKSERLRVNHRRLFNTADVIRKTPPFGRLRHVGKPEEHEERGVRSGLSRSLRAGTRTVGFLGGVVLVAAGSACWALTPLLALLEGSTVCYVMSGGLVTVGTAVSARSVL